MKFAVWPSVIEWSIYSILFVVTDEYNRGERTVSQAFVLMRSLFQKSTRFFTFLLASKKEMLLFGLL